MLMVLVCSQSGAAVGSISVIGLFRDKAVIIIDGRQHVLSAGETSPEGVKLISADSHRAILEVDGVRRSYSLGAAAGGSAPVRSGGDVVTIAPDSNGMYRIGGSINGFQVDFVVDTGATLVTMNGNDARRMGLQYRLNGTESEFSTASGIDRVYLIKLRSVRVGDIELHDVPCSVHDGDFPTDVLLGNSFLNRVSMERQGALLRLRALYSAVAP